MWQAVLSTASRFLKDVNRTWLREQAAVGRPRHERRAGSAAQPVRRVTLTDDVSQNLFAGYAAHRRSARGEEETGWVLLGHRERDEVVVLATLPAGMDCNAGVAHVAFNSDAQAVASRIVRQSDRRLRIVGVVHTHPGSLRHPSDGDYRGDSAWVGQLREGEGVFGIGTSLGERRNGELHALAEKRNVQCQGHLCFSWYALRRGDFDYRPLPYALTLGPDLARPLHPVWATIEKHSEALERLFCQQAGVQIDVVAGRHGPALSMILPLVEPERRICVVMEGNSVRYFLADGDNLSWVKSEEARVDRGIYLLLAELPAKG